MSFFPPRLFRRLPVWISNLPEAEQELLIEVYEALGTDSRRLAAMGCRALIDLFIVRTVGDAGTFAARLEQLENDGYLSRRSRQSLGTALDAGNAAAHRGYSPNGSELTVILDIVENLLHATVVATQAPELSTSIPRRATPKGETSL
ncbi:MAG: DUF4145 domain-containing protein [Gemmatimonadaceae bacterium]|nr:DUF4145 domain-containing protein [Gemmatimonadaceae bacterium]MCW5827091.1 DUF4145 domain-containing protein [Gemmatimonadaceae bacterium]